MEGRHRKGLVGAYGAMCRFSTQPAILSVEKQAAIGRFHLTRAVRPAGSDALPLIEGYRRDSYPDGSPSEQKPMLTAAISRERLFDVFMELLQPLGTMADVILESSRAQTNSQPVESYREQIDMPVLESFLWEFEDLISNDGFTGVAVLNPQRKMEVQFNEHKLLFIYAGALSPFEDLLDRLAVRENDAMKFVFESRHVHLSSPGYVEQFDQLSTRLAMDHTPV